MRLISWPSPISTPPRNSKAEATCCGRQPPPPPRPRPQRRPAPRFPARHWMSPTPPGPQPLVIRQRRPPMPTAPRPPLGRPQTRPFTSRRWRRPTTRTSVPEELIPGEWIVYNGAGHEGWGLRRPSAVAVVPADGGVDAAGDHLLEIMARMGSGAEAGPSRVRRHENLPTKPSPPEG